MHPMAEEPLLKDGLSVAMTNIWSHVREAHCAETENNEQLQPWNRFTGKLQTADMLLMKTIFQPEAGCMRDELY